MILSFIIPTYNRHHDLRRTLNGLAGQTLPNAAYEVIVVDDGSSDETGTIAQATWPMRLTYLRQANQGATVARNHGAAKAQGEILVFVDDDICLGRQSAAALARAVSKRPRTLVMGTLVPPGANPAGGAALPDDTAGMFVHFTFCKTGLLALRQSDFIALGRFQDPTGGWPNWDDVDFGYRAHLANYAIWQSFRATGEHWDYARISLAASCERLERVGWSAVRLLERYPDLEPLLPMLHDKTPVSWRQDPPGLIMRKILRQLSGLGIVHETSFRLAQMLERRGGHARWRRPFFRLARGGAIYRGFRRGLMEQTDDVRPGR